MKKQFIYNEKGKKIAILILMDEWEDIKKRLKKEKRKEDKATAVKATPKKALAPNKRAVKTIVPTAVAKKKAAVKKTISLGTKK